MPQLVLASSSPRRKELLQKLNIPFITYPSNADETIPRLTSPEQYVKILSERKALLARKKFPKSVVIGSDTIVVCDGVVLGKPQNRQEARKMLEKLSGRIHSVYTGVCVIDCKMNEIFFDKTDVEFWELSDMDIERYLDSGEPFDKAGAYGIQGVGALLVKSIKGDYYTVVGLPISRLARILMSKGLYPSVE